MIYDTYPQIVKEKATAQQQQQREREKAIRGKFFF